MSKQKRKKRGPYIKRRSPQLKAKMCKEYVKKPLISIKDLILVENM